MRHALEFLDSGNETFVITIHKVREVESQKNRAQYFSTKLDSTQYMP
jgi:hypothetical protein